MAVDALAPGDENFLDHFVRPSHQYYCDGDDDDEDGNDYDVGEDVLFSSFFHLSSDLYCGQGFDLRRQLMSACEVQVMRMAKRKEKKNPGQEKVRRKEEVRENVKKKRRKTKQGKE